MAEIFDIQRFAENIYGTSGDDTINESSGNFTVFPDDYRGISVYAYDGDDYISFDFLEYTTIDAGDGNDTVKFETSGGNIINGNNGDDYIYFTGLPISGTNTIYGGEGNDTIDCSSGAGYDSIDGGAGNDKITVNSNAAPSIVKGGTGNDIIYHKNKRKSDYGVLYQYNVGDGDDTIYGFSELDDIQIEGLEYSTLISGADLKVSVGNGSILLKDAASIESANIWGTIFSDEKGKTIGNINSNVTVNGTDYNDTISSYGESIKIYSGNGDDSIEIIGYIARRDIVLLGGNLVYAGYGNDTIQVMESFSNTVNAGVGDDLISISSNLSNNLIQYSNGDGNDTIYGINEDDTLQITGAKYSTVASGDDLIIGVGNGSILLKDAATIAVNIDGTLDGGEDTTPADSLPVGISISNSILTASSAFTGTEINLANYENATKVNASAVSQAVSIVGTAANNSLRGGSGKDTISGGSGNDTLTGGNGADIFIYSGGNDIITDYAAGQDKIKLSSDSISSASLSGNNVILKTASGNITIQNGKNKNITVIDSSGNETTKTYPETTPEDTTPADTLPVGISIKNSVLTASNKFTGNEINLDDYDNVTKINAAALSQAVTIIGSDSVTSIKGGKNSDTISGGNGKNTIFGGAGDDSILGGTDNDILKGDAGNDTIRGGSGNNTLTGGAGTDIFVYADGNDLITDYKTGEDKIQFNVADITNSTVKGSDVILTTAEGTVSIKGAKDKVVTFTDDSGADTDLIFFGDTYYAPLETGLTYDAKRTILTASTKFGGNEIDLENYLSNVTKLNASAISKNLEITATDSVTSIKAGKGADTISGGNGKNTVSGGAGNDSILSGSNDDKLLGEAGDDTLSGGIGKNTLTGGAGKDIFVYAGGNDLITDYKTGEDKIQFNVADITSSTVKSSDVILTTADGTISIKGAKDKVVTFTDNSGADTDLIFFADTYYAPLETGLAYDAKRTVLTAGSKFEGTEIDLENYLSSVTKVNASALSKNLEITATDSVTSIKAGKGADTISGGNGKNTISGGAGNDSILSGSNDDKLLGEAGDDTLSGGIGKNTLTGGAGNDIFVYAGGNDLITDYKTGEDKIQFNVADIENSTIKGSDVILTTGEGRISIKGAKDKVVTFTDDSGAGTDLIFFGDTYYAPLEIGLAYDTKRTVLTAGSKFEGTEIDLENYLSTVTKVNASSAKNAVEIVGNDNGNSIKGGKFADTISGGSGNDTLTGGKGADVFVYESGKDVITDYKAGEDTIQINGTISQTSYSGKDIIFNIGVGTLTVKNGKGKDIIVTDSSGTQTYSQTFDLLYDNNFVTDEFSLNEISEQKFEVTQIQTTTTETFEQEETLITFTDK